MIFDCHIHSSSGKYISWWHNVIKTEKDFLRYMRKCGIDMAVLLPGWPAITAKDYAGLMKGNRESFEMALRHPDIFIPAVLATPLCLEDSLTEMAHYRKEHNVVWLGEIVACHTGFKYDSPGFRVILKKAADLNMVVQLHGDAAELAFIPKEFPGLSLVIPHPGSTKAEIDAKIDLARKHKNVYLDLCGSGGDRLGNVEEMVSKFGSERILYGSDFTVNEPSVIISRIGNSLLKTSEKKAVLSGNLLRLLRSKGLKINPPLL